MIKVTKQILAKELKYRIAKVKVNLKKVSSEAVLIVSSGTKTTRSRDLHHAFHQDSDFFYLTGSESLKGCSLVVFANADPLLVAPEITKEQLLWDGPDDSASEIARLITAKLVTTDNILKTLKENTAGATHLFYPNTTGQAGLDLANYYLKTPSYLRRKAPIYLAHTDMIIEPLRVIKSRYEIKIIKQAVSITASAIQAVKEELKLGVTEGYLAAIFEQEVKKRGGRLAFDTIIATGKNAATLHHRAGLTKIQPKELVLIDCGAAIYGYCGDVSRCLLLDTGTNKKIISLKEKLLEVQRLIISKIRPNINWINLHQECQELLLKVLYSENLLSGSIAKHRKNETIKTYFPHSLGHTLGIDVHDVGALRSSALAANQKSKNTKISSSSVKLKTGMVVTVEPGLYFPKGLKSLPPCGFRIEDDILVTKTGYQNLTSKIPY